jgi:hypothetical protein
MLHLTESHDIYLFGAIKCDFGIRSQCGIMLDLVVQAYICQCTGNGGLACPLVTDRRYGNTMFLMAGSLENCDESMAFYSFFCYWP